MSRRTFATRLSTVVAALTLIAVPALAQVMIPNPDHLAAVGPISGANHYPVWYRDSNGTRLELCLDKDDPNCPAFGDLPDPAQQISFPDNFPDESFYMLGNAQMTTGGGAAPGKGLLVLGLEAAFGGTGAVAEGQQVVFGRVRYRVTNAVPNAEYTFTHPYGTETVTADPDGRLFFTDDIGITPGRFDDALNSRIAPFLRWTSGAAKAPGEADPPAGYIGDGATDHTITGSPVSQNFFRIEGPNIAAGGGPACPGALAGPDCIQTSLFTLQGKLATTAGVDITRATYARTSGGDVTVDVFAGSEPGQSIQVAGDGIPATLLPGEAGRYAAHISAGSTLPPTVRVTNAGDVPPTVKTQPVVDGVTVTRAQFDSVARTLTVTAASSDQQAKPELTVTGFGVIDPDGDTTFTDVTAPPPSITVTSAAGGKDTEDVVGAGAVTPPLPVMAVAGPDQTVQQGQQVTLDGSSSQGTITSFGWEQVGTPSVTLTGADTARATFTAPNAAGALTFRLTTTGPAGTSTSTVTVTVQAVAVPTANAGPDQTVPVGATVRLDGSASTGAASFSWSATSGGQGVVLTGANTATPSFAMPPTGPVTATLTVTGPGGTATDSVVVTPAADQLAGTAEFRTGQRQWRVRGTATGALPDTVTVRFNGQVLGTAPVDATGAWDVRPADGTGPVPQAPATVTVTSSRGGSITLPVTIRN
jgi:hypothetical protein